MCGDINLILDVSRQEHVRNVAELLLDIIEQQSVIAALCVHILNAVAYNQNYRQMKLTDNISHTCRSCLEILQQFPFSNTSLNFSLESNTESASDNYDSTSVWADYDNIFVSNQRNFNIGHINANSIGGLKFCEIKSWLLSG